MIKQNAIVDRFNAIVKDFQDLRQTVDFTLCPLVSCLFENQTIQLRCEEQEDLDKLKIALYGHKEDIQRKAEQAAYNRKAEPDQAKNSKRGSRPFDNVKRGSTVENQASRATKRQNTIDFNALDSL